MDKKGTEEEVSESSAKRKVKRDAFFDALEGKGMQFETQDPKVLLCLCCSGNRILTEIFTCDFLM